MRFLDRSTRKVATCIEDSKTADVNWVYLRVDRGEFFRKRSWIDRVVARNTNVENEGEATRWRDDAYIANLYAFALVRKREVFVWRWNPKGITPFHWFKEGFINLITCLGCERTSRS